MSLFITITLAVVVGEWVYGWLIAVQNTLISRFLRRKFADQLAQVQAQAQLASMPVGKAN